MHIHNLSDDQSLNGRALLRFVLAAASSTGGLVYRGDFSTSDRALLALESHLEPAKLDVVCAEVWRAANGNIRLWQHYRIHVLVELVDPTQGLVGGDDIEEAPATLDLRTGAIELDNPKRGYPMLHWADCGATITFCGERYSCFIQRDNLPAVDRCSGADVVEFIKENGYHAVLDLMTLEHCGAALSSF